MPVEATQGKPSRPELWWESYWYGSVEEIAESAPRSVRGSVKKVTTQIGRVQSAFRQQASGFGGAGLTL